MSSAPPTSRLLNTPQDSLARLVSLSHVLSVVDKYDGNPATLKLGLLCEKHVGQRGRDLKAKKTLAYLRTSGPMEDFIKEQNSLQE